MGDVVWWITRVEGCVASIGGKTGVVKDAGAVAVCDELGEEFCFVCGEVVACQLVGLGWRGGEELSCNYKFWRSVVSSGYEIDI